MSIIESARRDWAEGHRRFLEAAAEPGVSAPSHQELQLILQELRRTVGSSFTMDELGEAYTGAEVWAQRALAERATSPNWPRRLTCVVDAAFHAFSRGAADYAP